MTIREDVSNFKFFNCFEFDAQGGTHDVNVAAVTCAQVDTQGYDTVLFGWMHGSMLSVGSHTDGIHVRMQHASNSTTGINTLGSWSDCEVTDIYGQDFYRLISTLTMDSWLALDPLTREPYLYSMAPDIAVPGRCVSGCFTHIGISVTSNTDCATRSHMPTVAYIGKQRWVRLVFSLSTALANSTGSMPIMPFCMLGRPGQWPVALAENV